MSKKTIYSPAYRRLIQRLRERRLELVMTQSQVAGRVGRRKSWLSKVEQCERRLDFLETIDLLRVLKIEPDEAVRIVLQGKP